MDMIWVSLQKQRWTKDPFNLRVTTEVDFLPKSQLLMLVDFLKKSELLFALVWTFHFMQISAQ